MKTLNSTRTWWLNLPSLVWLLLFFAVPTLILFLISFKPAGLYGGIEPGWTIQAWENSMSGPGFRIMLWRTLYLTFGATFICLALAVPCAWYMVNQPPHRRSLLMLLVMIPFGTSFLVRILAWKVLLHPEGYFLNFLTASGVVPEGTMLLYRESAVLMVLVYAYLPFAILPVYAVAEKFDFTLMDAARDLGASTNSALFGVFLPGLKPGLITAVLMVMVPVLGSYVIPDLVGGPSAEMLGNKIAQRSFADRNLPQAAALASALTILVLVPMLAHIWRRPGTSNQGGVMKKNWFSGAVLSGVLLFFYIPMAVVVANSFNTSRFGGQWQGFTLMWYSRLFEDGSLWEALVNTLIVGISATAIAVVLGTLAALGLHRARGSLFRAHFSLVYLPLAVPDILMGISLLLFFSMLKVQLGLGTIILAHACFCISYVAMVVLARLEDFDTSTLEAARDLGAGPLQATFRILIPQMLPAIIAGALLSFTLSVDDYVITFFVTGPGATTLPLRIYSMIKHGSPPVINALSTLILASTFVSIALARRLSRKELFP